MTPPVTYVPQQTAAEAFADVVRALCAQITEKERQLQAARDFGESQSQQRTRAEVEKVTVDRRLGEVRKTLTEANAEIDKLRVGNERAQRNLSALDRLTLDLYHYIVELAGHRDTAKTKAERIALGHVVERLKDIRGLNDAEQAAVS